MDTQAVHEKLLLFKANNEAMQHKDTREPRLLSESVLRNMLKFAPSATGYASVERAILQSMDDAALHDLGQYYLNNFIYPSQYLICST